MTNKATRHATYPMTATERKYAESHPVTIQDGKTMFRLVPAGVSAGKNPEQPDRKWLYYDLPTEHPASGFVFYVVPNPFSAWFKGEQPEAKATPATAKSSDTRVDRLESDLADIKKLLVQLASKGKK